MKIQEKDFYYGVVLAQLAEHPVFTSINKVTEKEGLYLVNDSKRLLIKYSSLNGPVWRFTFRADDFTVADGHELFFVLVCGSSTICLLYESEIKTLVDPTSKTSQWISVAFPANGQIRAKGPLGRLKHTVPHNAFPKDIFGRFGGEVGHYVWPPLSKLNFYADSPNLTFSTEDRRLDLSDRFGERVRPGNKPTVVYFGLATVSHKWRDWSEKNLRAVEEIVKYDLEFDGFDVVIERFTNPISRYNKRFNKPCTSEFVWKLKISSG